MFIHESLERRHGFGVAPNGFKAETQFVEGGLIGRILPESIPEHVDGLLPESDVFVLKGDVDVQISAEGTVPEVKRLAVMVDGLLVTIRLGIECGQREVNLIVGRLESQQVSQPGNRVMYIASTGHELGLAQLERQALWYILPA